MDDPIKARLKWVELYKQTQDAGLVCRRCGISRPTLRKWWRRFEESGVEGLQERSRRPKTSPKTKVGDREDRLISELRKKRKLGARRIQNELFRLHDLSLSLATIHKVLVRQQAPPLKRVRRKETYTRYERPIPGERVQMDTTKIGAGLFQYTAVDDCTRYRVLRLFPRRTAANTLLFLAAVVEEMPFPIQRVQTDRGREFFAVKVQKRLMEYGIKFRPVRPRSPHLNGKVERSQKTDKDEFYSTVDLGNETLQDELADWQHHYNWQRPHGAHKGKTPMERYFQVSEETPLSEAVLSAYDATKERIQEPNYRLEMELRKLQRSL